MKKLYVLSLGGSLIAPGDIDINFLKKFKKLILSQIKNGRRFVIVAGGGRLCRRYNEALSKICRPKPAELDWMGINSTWLNGKLVQLMFGKKAYEEVQKNPAKKIKTARPILVGGGWKPGRSSDGAAIKYAQTYGAKILINLSNVDYVYDKDPRKFKNAKKLPKLAWNEFLDIAGRKWTPGLNLPFDPIAAKFAQKNNLQVIIANGKNLKNLRNIFEEKKFQGTVIS